jgi:hypothetical protein
MTELKAIFVSMAAALMAHIESFATTMMLVIVAAIADIFVGYVSGKTVHEEKFKFAKFIQAVKHVFVYVSILAAVYVVGTLQGDASETEYVEKMITYVFLFFYGKNVLRNLREMLPESKAITLLDDWIGLEFLARIPGEARVLNKGDKSNDNGTGNNNTATGSTTI